MVWFVGMVHGLRALVGVGSCTSDCHRVEEGGGCGGVGAEWMVMLVVVESGGISSATIAGWRCSGDGLVGGRRSWGVANMVALEQRRQG